MRATRLGACGLVLTLVMPTVVSPPPAMAASAAEINRAVDASVAKLGVANPEAKVLAQRARAVLVFPNIVKAGFLFGAQYGEGALRRQGKTVGYYNTVAASYGWQAGVQSFGYVLLFMSESALKYLDQSEGFEIGVGPSVVVLDSGVAKTLTTSTTQSDIYAFIFDQQGLMAGAGLQGSKISRIAK
jgi:lipid-binding SYLF domain-containing protein